MPFYNDSVKVETEFKSPVVPIKGICHEDFQEVAETFAKNFDIYNEIGSSICVVVDGETTVDLWAGYKNDKKQMNGIKIHFLLLFHPLKQLWRFAHIY